jgi:Lrp/AsnC family transcriptional regulator, regulator for asnA, asnC and gidA
MRQVDHVDIKIVRFMTENPRASYAEVARAIGVSQTTARRRIDALIEDRVITPAVIPDVRRLGFEVLALVGIKVDLAHLNETAEKIRQMQSVTSLHMTMGRYELIATIAEPSLDDLRKFMVERIAPLPGIRDTETFVSSRALKILRDWRLPELVEFEQPVRRIRRQYSPEATTYGSTNDE